AHRRRSPHSAEPAPEPCSLSQPSCTASGNVRLRRSAESRRANAGQDARRRSRSLPLDEATLMASGGATTSSSAARILAGADRGSARRGGPLPAASPATHVTSTAESRRRERRAHGFWLSTRQGGA